MHTTLLLITLVLTLTKASFTDNKTIALQAHATNMSPVECGFHSYSSLSEDTTTLQLSLLLGN